jgi:cell division protein FtsB
VEIFNRRSTYLPISLILVLCYIVYHIISGNRGIISMMHIKNALEERKKLLHQLKLEQEDIENQVKLLQPENYDLDFVDELARDYFGLVGKKEKVIMLQNQKNSQN